MAEEHRFQSPEGHHLCANNCGFFGSPATLNLCSKCYRDHCLKEEQASSAKIAVEKSLNVAGASVSSPSVDGTLTDVAPALSVRNLIAPASASSVSSFSDSAAPPEPAQPNRCSTCRKRVGLTGFRCRCGATYCGSHRYPEQHGCSFDFRAAGREEIAKANPVVKAAKLDKI